MKAGGFIFLSAVRGVDPETGKPPEETEKQARLLFENMEHALHAAGATLQDVVKIAVYMMDLQGDRPVFNRVWQEHFGDEPPARFAVQVLDMGTAGDNSKFLADVTAVAPDPHPGPLTEGEGTRRL
ncbi:MAG TPA: RidA family protein [Chloroflexota bacterium]|nr:RidA family protein [Chloroflexota bacterium]